jgi:hypothetical protein
LKLINGVRIDGKNFKTDRSFALQRVSLDTRVIAIEDVRKNIDFESFYSIITDGTTVERKNRDEIYISFEHSPKILFSTNYTIVARGNHGKRRQMVFEFSKFYHPGYTPENQFKHRLFEDWNKDEWNSFYNYMLLTVFYYLNAAILAVNKSESSKRKQIKQNYTSGFLDWWLHYSQRNCDEWLPFSHMYNDFISTSEFESKEYSKIRFHKAYDEAANLFGFKVKKRGNRREKNRVEYRLIKRSE